MKVAREQLRDAVAAACRLHGEPEAQDAVARALGLEVEPELPKRLKVVHGCLRPDDFVPGSGDWAKDWAAGWAALLAEAARRYNAVAEASAVLEDRLVPGRGGGRASRWFTEILRILREGGR